MPQHSAIITGASRGIGLGLVRALADKGFSVIATARDPNASDGLQELVSGGLVEAHTLDVDDPVSINALAKAVKDQPIRLLIHNAAILKGQEDLAAFDTSDFLSSMRTNVVGPVLLTRALLSNLKAAGNATILHVSSQMGSVEGNSSAGDYPYRASKAAMNMVSKGLANELRDYGVVSVAMHPGRVKTELGGKEAPLLPDVAAREMIETTLGLTLDHTGSFIQRSGEVIPY
ncbi:MAG: SDR family oxidoreductase [Phycisphaerales bacterium]